MAREPIGHRAASATIALALLVPLFGSTAFAQHDVQMTPDSLTRLVSKDVGNERWAISLDVATGVVTGNVYHADGSDPQYVWCLPQDASTDPVRLRCQGTSGCDEWVDLGEVQLAASFFGPAACEAPGTTPEAVAMVAHPAVDATAPSSGLRLTPDTRRSLIAKDIGGLRWTMSYDHVKSTMTGNVFDPSGGPAQFVSCRYDGGRPDAQFTCVGAAGCACGACSPSDWKTLPDVTLPTSFFTARRCPATAPPHGLVATLRPSRAEDAVDEQGSNGGFAAGVAVSGNVAVTGSQEKAVYVFENGPNGWQQAARIEPIEPYEGRAGTGRFGAQFAVSGTRAALIDNTGVQVLERGDGSWTQLSTIIPPERNARVGSVDIDGSTVALTVSFSDLAQPNRIHVYERAGDRWNMTATIPLPGRAPFEEFGGVHLAGDRIVVFVEGGATPYPPAFTQASLDVFERRSGEWIPTSSVAYPYSPLDPSYPTLALTSDSIVYGSSPDSLLDRTRGAIRWLAPQGDRWSEAGTFSSCSPDVGHFGDVLAVSGDTLVVGAPDDTNGGAAGEVHVFTRSTGGWTATGRLRVGDTAIDSLALDGHTLFVGSTLLHSPTGGSIQVFDLDQVELLPPVPCPDDPPEVWPGDEWRVEPATEHGMNPAVLARAGEYALQPGSNTQGVVVARHGVIVAEWYENGRDATSYGASWSVAKSIASALIGVAIERGDVRDEHMSMAEFYPEWAGTEKEAITLRNVLQMTSGLEFGENHSTTPNNVSDIAYLASMAKDHLSYVLEKPLINPPGTVFNYSSGDTMLLSGVIESATGVTAGDYARRYLFDPLGMSRAQWWADAVGHTLTYCCFDAPSREFARIGLLYARNGRWNGQQILPERWVGDSTASVHTPNGDTSYGYQWYTSSQLMYAFGFDDQWIYVIPDLDLVVVRNGHYDKYPGPPIADPNLFALYPAAGLVPGKGTKPPEVGWSAGDLLNLVLDSIVAR